MSAHTPGPWTAECVGDTGGYNPEEVWEVVALNGFLRVSEGLSAADARLVAAAPDLLADLRAASNYIDTLGGVSKSYRAAIAKATGGDK